MSPKNYSTPTASPNMSDRVIAELKESAVHSGFFGVAATEVVDEGSWEVHEVLGRRVSTNWQTNRPWDFRSAIVFRNEDGSVFQVKASNPRKDATSGKAIKYESPALEGDSIASPYMPYVGNEVRELIGQRYGIAVPTTEAQPSFWAWAQSTKLQIVLTEGAKKSLALLSAGYIAIGLTGVFSGVRSWSGRGIDRAKMEKAELHPSLAEMGARPWVLAMDRDTNPTTIKTVNTAKENLAYHLSRNGATIVGDASWDSQYKGADDLIAALGPEAIAKAIDEAADTEIQKKVRKLQNRVTRTPDIKISGDFSKIAGCRIPTSGLVVFRGGKGTGKSTAIEAMVRGRTWLSVTALQSLGRAQAASWGGTFYNDADRAAGRIIDESGHGMAYSVCVPSLRAVSNLKPEVLVVDESTAVQRFLLDSSLANKDGCRQFLIEAHDEIAKVASLTILADADMDEATIAHYEAVTGHKAFYICSDFQPLGWTANIIEGDTATGVGALIEHIKDRAPEDGRLLFISTDSKMQAERISQILSSQLHRPLKSLLITSETGANPDVRALLSSNGMAIPSLIAMGYGAIVASPSVTQGFSIHANTDLIDSVWGIYVGGSITPAAAAQALDRVRDSGVPRYINAVSTSSAASKHSKATNSAQWLADLKESTDMNHRVLLRDLASPSEAVQMGADRINWEAPALKLMAHYEADKNLTSMAFRDWLIANLVNEGKTIKSFEMNPVARADAKTHLEAATRIVETDRAERIIAADILTPKDAMVLADKATKTQAESSALDRYHAVKFYATSEAAGDLTVELLIADKRGRRRASIIRAEYALNSELALNASANSIAKSNIPTDQDKAAILTFVGEAVGINELVRDILNGEVTKLSSETVTKIATTMRSYDRQIKILFGFRNLEKIADQQLVGQMLDRFGIKTSRTTSGYEVNKEAVEELVTIIKRRGVAQLKMAATPAPIAHTWKSEFERQQLVKAGLIPFDLYTC